MDMKKVHVFNAGPCLLPQVAIDNAIEALKDFKGTGISVLPPHKGMGRYHGRMPRTLEGASEHP